jgi:hypothetical protein
MSAPAADDLLSEEAALYPALRFGHGDGPGLHALIVGVSRYPHLPAPGAEPTALQQRHGLGLEQLTAAARTGCLVYRWLLHNRARLPARLASCRLLLAAVASELEATDGLEELASDALLQSFHRAAKAWRADAASDPDNVALFYFAGHGFQRKRGSNHVLLLEDTGNPAEGGRLFHAFEARNLVDGMAASGDYERVARRQLFFFDACRLPLTEGYRWEDEKSSEIWSVSTIAHDDRTAVEYYTTEPGAEAFEIASRQTMFSRALLRCLRGAGADEIDGRWCVTVDSLNAPLRHHLTQVAGDYESSPQRFRVAGGGDQMEICRLAQAPRVQLAVTVVPGSDAPLTEVTATDFSTTETFGPPLLPQPFPAWLRAGQYVVTTRTGAVERRRVLGLKPPHGAWDLP